MIQECLFNLFMDVLPDAPLEPAIFLIQYANVFDVNGTSILTNMQPCRDYWDKYFHNYIALSVFVCLFFRWPKIDLRCYMLQMMYFYQPIQTPILSVLATCFKWDGYSYTPTTSEGPVGNAFWHSLWLFTKECIFALFVTHHKDNFRVTTLVQLWLHTYFLWWITEASLMKVSIPQNKVQMSPY